MGAETLLAHILELLDDEEGARLKSITVSDTGATLEFYPQGLARLPNGQLAMITPDAPQPQATYEDPDSEDPEPMPWERSPLEDASLTQFVDLFTLTALSKDEGFTFGYDDAARWLDVDAMELKQFLEEGYHQLGLGIWEKTLTGEERRLMKLAFQNIVLVAPKGSIRATVERLSKSRKTSEDMRKHIVTRYQLGQHVAIALRAAQNAAQSDENADMAVERVYDGVSED